MSASEWKALLERAKQGDAEAEWGVAERYEDGVKDKKGKVLVRRSTRKAAEWLLRAADHGCASAQNNLGVLLGNKDLGDSDVREAMLLLTSAFRAGESCAASNIAITYRESGDFRKAVEWFRKSIASRDGDSLVQLEIHYYWGKGLRRNPAGAVRLFRKATRAKNISEAGRDDAFFYLGIAYLEGKGVEPSLSAARKLLQRANLENDHPAARRILQNLKRP